MILRIKQLVIFHLAIAASVLTGLVPAFQSEGDQPDPVSREAYHALLEKFAKLRDPAWNGPFFTVNRSTNLPNAPQLLLLSFGPDSTQTFQNSPPAAVDYAVILHEIEKYGTRRVALTDPLFWENQEFGGSMQRLGIHSLLNELRAMDSVLLGTPVDRAAQTQTLSTVMRATAIPIAQFSGDVAALPTANQVPLKFPQQLPKGTRLTPTHISGQTDFIENPDGSIKVPLLIRWGNEIIPTFTLGLVCDLLGASFESLLVNSGSHIQFPKGNQIAIDEFGYASLDLVHSPAHLHLEAEALLLEKDADRSPNQKLFNQASVVLIGHTDSTPAPVKTSELQPYSQRPEFLAHTATALAGHSAITTRTLLSPAKPWVYWVLLFNAAILGAVSYGKPLQALLRFPALLVGIATLLAYLGLKQGIWLSLPEIGMAALFPAACIPLLAWWKGPKPPTEATEDSSSKEPDQIIPTFVELDREA